MKKYTLFGIVVIITILFSLGLSNSDTRNFQLSKNLSIYQSILRELNIAFVDDIDPKELINESIKSMLSSLDPYTSYIPEEDLDDFRLMTTGEYAGIGAIIGKKDDHVIIVEPYKNFPADKTGLHAGDMLIEINGKNVIGQNTSDIVKLLRGNAGSSVTVKVKRPYQQDSKNEIISYIIVRENIQLKCVPHFGILDNNIGYIILTNFTEQATNAVKNAIVELKSKGAKSLILDVRNNPGGLLSQAVNVTNLFVDKGTEIVSTKGKNNKSEKKYIARNFPVDKDIPLVILVNENSASASEILAGSIQDVDRGVIIGSRTFGKGLVQQTRPLAFDAQLKLTTAYYYLPSGRSIQKKDFKFKSKKAEDKKDEPIKENVEYQTKNGRKVYDNGGIKPDFLIENPTFSKLSSYLSSNYTIFDFATKYATTHSQILPPKKFKISDKDFKEFKTFLNSKELNYSTESNEALAKLIKIAKKENFLTKIQDEVNSIEGKIASNFMADIDTFKEELVALISYEITKRYYYKDGAIENTLSNDVVLKKAMEVLANVDLYTNTLTNNTFVENSN